MRHPSVIYCLHYYWVYCNSVRNEKTDGIYNHLIIYLISDIIYPFLKILNECNHRIYCFIIVYEPTLNHNWCVITTQTENLQSSLTINWIFNRLMQLFISEIIQDNSYISNYLGFPKEIKIFNILGGIDQYFY